MVENLDSSKVVNQDAKDPLVGDPLPNAKCVKVSIHFCGG